MNTNPVILAGPPTFLKAIAHDIRWRLMTTLAHSDYRVNELVRLLDQPPNLVSYHLKRLRQLKLVADHRSAADHRDVYYSLSLGEVQRLYLASGEALHPALVAGQDTVVSQATAREAPARVLFLCTHNSARSQMAEGLLRHMSRGEVEAHSAGTEPRELHTLAVKVMAERGIDIRRQRPTPISQYIGQHFDYIITVCDVARESCPVFPGDPERIHWSFPDPAEVPGLAARRRAFNQTAIELTTRLSYLLLVIKRNHRQDNGKAG